MPQPPQPADTWKIKVIQKEKFDISSLDPTTQDVNFSDIVNTEILVILTFALLLEREKIFF
jgi:hypothetical protein